MEWFRTEITIIRINYVEYLLAENIYAARVQLIGKYGSRITSKARIDFVKDVPELKKIIVILNDLREFALYEVVCNEEHAKRLCYQKYGRKKIKRIIV